jgi:uncharacterized membrane protein YkoI
MKIVRTWILVTLGLVINAGWLLAAAKAISMTQAKRIALKVSPGKIESAEREMEKGRDVYSFDIRREGQTNIDEVLIDAQTGKVINHTTETPAEQAAEKKEPQ